MKSKRKKEPVKPSNSFYCPTCDETMEGAEAFKKHLTDAHKITDFKGTKRTIMHVDCSDAYYSQNELLIGGLRFEQSTASPRRKNDLLYRP